MTCFPPEWFCAQKYDENSRKLCLGPALGLKSLIFWVWLQRDRYLTPTAGQVKLETEVFAAEELPNTLAVQGREIDRRPLPENFAEVPLTGWPNLVSEGQRVRLTNLRAKNGLTGTLVNRFEDGKWQVELDDGSGSALLRPNCFEVLSEKSQKPLHTSPAAYSTAAVERQWKIEEKRAKLKEKIAAKRQAILSAAAA